MRTSFATIPRAQRKLLTYHDAYAYFGRDYGWDVIGAIQVSDFEEPTPKEVAGLIDQIRAEKVPAIFGSEVFPSPVLAQIGKEAGVEYVDVLRDDDLPGRPGDPEHSWIGLMHFDYVTMTEAMGGDATALKAFKPAQRRPGRRELSAMTQALVELADVTYGYGAEAVLERHRPRRRRRASSSGSSGPRARARRRRCASSPAACSRRTGASCAAPACGWPTSRRSRRSTGASR